MVLKLPPSQTLQCYDIWYDNPKVMSNQQYHYLNFGSYLEHSWTQFTPLTGETTQTNIIWLKSLYSSPVELLALFDWDWGMRANRQMASAKLYTEACWGTLLTQVVVWHTVNGSGWTICPPFFDRRRGQHWCPGCGCSELFIKHLDRDLIAERTES